MTGLSGNKNALYIKNAVCPLEQEGGCVADQYRNCVEAVRKGAMRHNSQRGRAQLFRRLVEFDVHGAWQLSRVDLR